MADTCMYTLTSCIAPALPPIQTSRTAGVALSSRCCLASSALFAARTGSVSWSSMADVGFLSIMPSTGVRMALMRRSPSTTVAVSLSRSTNTSALMSTCVGHSSVLSAATSASNAAPVSLSLGAHDTAMVLCASSLTGRRRSNAATTSASVTSSAFFIQSHASTSAAVGRCMGSRCTIARNTWSSSLDTCQLSSPTRRYSRSMGSSSLESGVKRSPRPRSASAMLCLIRLMRPTPVSSSSTSPAAHMSAAGSRYIPSSSATTSLPMRPPRTASAGKMALS
mmetsp:Transcript_7350/g.18212  ORF Transcript_7350/g.18212 Transcript_7350/m.18212 type:complete len:280 (-) Transcript_7350:1546-2385(-)